MVKIDLNKGDRFLLNKEELSKIQVAFSWASAINLDASAFLLREDGVIGDDADFVFYNSKSRTEPYDRQKFGSKANWRNETVPMSKDGSVIGPTDYLGGEDPGETMYVDLTKVRPEVSEIVFCITIYSDWTFKDAKDPKIIITDVVKDEVLCQYHLKEHFSSETAVVAGSLVLNEEGEWEFEAIGKAYDGGLSTLVDMFFEE